MAEYIKRADAMTICERYSAHCFEASDSRGQDIADRILDDIAVMSTADVVEVVRCKDCKYLYCFSAIDRQFYCKHYPNGLQGINIVEENPFCSYGERSDK